MGILSVLFSLISNLLAIVGLLVVVFALVIKLKPAILLALIRNVGNYKESMQKFGATQKFFDEVDKTIEEELGDIPMFSKKKK